MFPFTLQQLRMLKAIATEKNFTKAADVLYLSQPSLSKQIQTLEKNLKVTLLHRDTKKISLTEHGKIMVHYSERILGICEECCRVLTDLKTGERGNLKIGASPMVARYFLPKVLELFIKNYPSIPLKITIQSTSRILQSVQARKMDLGLISGQISERFQKTLGMEELMEDEIRFIVPKSYGLDAKRILSKNDLYQFHFISLTAGSKFRECLETSLRQNDIEVHQLKIILEVHSMEALKLAVKLGLGVAFVTSSTLETERKEETIQVLKIEDTNLTQSFLLLKNLQSLNKPAFTFFNRALSTLKNSTEMKTKYNQILNVNG